MKTERLVWAHLYTSRGAILGAVRVPAGLSLLRHVNGPGRFLHLAQVASGWSQAGSEVLAIRKKAVQLIVPQVDERVAPSPRRGRGVRHHVTMLFAAGEAAGVFDLARGRSPASYLERSEPFVVLEACRPRLPRLRLPREGVARAALVNVEAVVGVAASGERAEARAAGRRRGEE